MRLVYFFLLLMFLFFSINKLVNGQARPIAEPFPTYQQIKPVSTEIIDYVPKSGASGVKFQKTFNLFDYPEYPIIYLLNGKPVPNKKYVKKLLNRKETHIERAAIGQPTTDGKLLIVIDYSSKK